MCVLSALGLEKDFAQSEQAYRLSRAALWTLLVDPLGPGASTGRVLGPASTAAAGGTPDKRSERRVLGPAMLGSALVGPRTARMFRGGAPAVLDSGRARGRGPTDGGSMQSGAAGERLGLGS